MATLKYGSNSLLALTSRITTPSIHIQKDDNHWYVPLFSGDKGSVVQNGDYNYTLGGLKVGIYRAAIDREEVSIDNGVAHVFANGITTWILTSNGELYGCGNNADGNQGSGNTYDVLVFTKRAENVKEVVCTIDTTWYIDNDGNLYGCGNNDYGQQGSGESGERTDVKIFTKRAENVKEISCAHSETWYIDNNNNLYGCGNNRLGQQGSGDTSDVYTFTKRAENVKEVKCCHEVTWYIDNNGNLYGCGNNYHGQQGSGESGDRTNVKIFTKRAENVKEINLYEDVTWYIDNDGNLYGCGDNDRGQQGSGESGERTDVKIFTKRAENVKKVISSYNSTWYIDNDGNLYGCGGNDDGQQGSGDTSEVHIFTKRAENVKEVDCLSSTYYSHGVTWYIDNNGNLYGCGDNYYGQQGSGDTSDVYTFTKRAENVKEIVCSSSTTWYIDNNGNLYGCGNNNSGQQGSGEWGSGTNVLVFTKRDL